MERSARSTKGKMAASNETASEFIPAGVGLDIFYKMSPHVKVYTSLVHLSLTDVAVLQQMRQNAMKPKVFVLSPSSTLSYCPCRIPSNVTRSIQSLEHLAHRRFIGYRLPLDSHLLTCHFEGISWLRDLQKCSALFANSRTQGVAH